MGSNTSKGRSPATIVENARPRLRLIARESQWSLTEYVCSAGPHDRAFEERHDRMSIALVTSGTFRYRTDTGEGILYPGAFLLGNAGSCYECGHEHSRGDRCLALHFDRELAEEIASGSNLCHFRAAILPALPDLASVTASLQQSSMSHATFALEDAVLSAVETVLRIAATNRTPPRGPKPASTRRMAAIFNYIDAELDSDLSLAALSAQVGMSKYHFIRTFRHASGMTPHQYILGRRIRAAATELRATNKPVSGIALEYGFGDLSTFNHYFRRVLGTAPTAYRSTCVPAAKRQDCSLKAAEHTPIAVRRASRTITRGRTST